MARAYTELFIVRDDDVKEEYIAQMCRDYKVDGFRFDLASIFAMKSDGKLDTEHPPIFGQIGSTKGLQGARLIAEPWDAAGTYQLGRSFPGWRDNPEHMAIAIEYIDEFVAQSDVYPLEPNDG